MRTTQRSELEALLPEVFRRTIIEGGLLDGLLEVMLSLQNPSERILERLPTYLDPYRTPPEFLPYLAGWVDLDRFLSDDAGDSLPAGSGHLRQLIANAARLSGVRGTAAGLRAFLELASGERGFEIVEGVSPDGRPAPFSLRVRCPVTAAGQRPLLERIVASEKPVHVVAHLVFDMPAATA